MLSRVRILLKMRKKSIGKLFFYIIVSTTIFWFLYLAFFSNRISSNRRKQSPVNVLLVAYSRSGSSLLGELLSTTPHCSYFFEPLFYPCVQLKVCRNIRNFLQNIVECQGEMLYTLAHKSSLKIVRQMQSMTNFKEPFYYSPTELSRLCHKDHIHLVKTIRLRMRDVLALVRSGRVENLRVVHLVRDPRARFYSLQSGGNWDPRQKALDTVCEQMESDLRLAAYLPKHVYTRIRYEDVVKDPLNVVNQLFSALYERRIGDQTVNYIRTHMVGGESERRKKKGKMGSYYVTYRNSSFDPNRWKKFLNQSMLRLIEEKCKFVIDELKY